MKRIYFNQPLSQVCRKKIFLPVLFLLLFPPGMIAGISCYGKSNDSNPNSQSDTSVVNEKKYKPKISGFVQVHFLEPINTNGDNTVAPDRFRVLRARLCVKGKINKYAGYDIEIDPRSPQITGILRDAFISLNVIPHHELRVGQQKTVFGYENWESSTHLFVVNRAEVSDNLSRGLNLRDIGIGIFGKVKLSDNFRFEDAFQIVNGAGMNVAGIEDFNRKKNFWGRVGLRYKDDAIISRFGISGGIGDLKDQGDDPVSTADDFIINFKRIGADFEINHKLFFMAAEYVFGWETDTIETAQVPGYYVLLAGKTKWHIGPMIRFDGLEDQYRRWTFGAYYGLPAAKLRMLINYEMLGFHNDEFPNGDDDRLYVQLQLRF
jgi:hypothetical protein